MTKNNKPVLSILIDKDKRDRFAEFARRNNLSMGYLVNQAIDRMLESDSIDTFSPIYRQSVATPSGVNSPTEAISRSDVEQLIKTYIDSLGGVISVVSTDPLYKTLSRENIEEIIETIIDKERERLDGLIKSYGENKEITSIAIEDIRSELSELSRNLQGEIASIAKTPFRRSKADSCPDWVKKDERRFYSLLVDNSELLEKVAEAIETNSGDNSSLAASLLELGIHKQDGACLDSSSISRIKNVTKQLKPTPDSPLPLFNG